jgi:predicted Ser/Thr protein kinase
MRGAGFLLVVLFTLLLAGCGGGTTVPVATWALDAQGVHETITVPKHFDRELGDHEQHYTLRTSAEVPAELRGKPVALAIPYFAGRATLRANGVDAPDLDVTEFDRYRSVGPHRFLVPGDVTRAGTLDLVLDVDHRWTQSAWLDTVPRLADASGGTEYALVTTFNQASAGAALAMILLVAVAYGLIYLSDRRRTAYGWFCLSSLAGAFYSAFALGLLQPLCGPLDGDVVGFCVTLSAISAIMFTGAIFDHKPSRAWWGLLALWCVMAIVRSGPFGFTRGPTPVAILTMLAAGAFCVRMLVQAMRKGRPPLAAVLATIAWPVVCVLALDDSASWLGMGELYHGFRGACLGTVLVAVLQAAALGAQLMQSLHRADALNAALEARVVALESTNAEVRTLNEELRRQIGNRSTQLAETLARVGSLHLPVLALEPGDVVEGRYKVVRFLASGGMSWVYEVERVTDRKRVALKLLHGKSSGAALARFAREARLASEIDHPGIVGVVDVDMTREGVLYIVMEFVDGVALEERVADDPPIAWSLGVLRQIAEGLQAVHARGVVHRDLKPANVLIEERSDGVTAKIVDFGVSMLLSEGVRTARTDTAETEGDVRITRAGRVMGTPAYMAPELAVDGTPLHPSIDMYAFGVMAYELLVGRLPFRDPLFVRRVHGRSIPPPPSLAVTRPKLDRAVAEIVDRCLSLDPSARPTATEAAAALRGAHAETDPSSMPSVKTAQRA